MDTPVLNLVSDQKPLWTQDEAIAYEVARETINRMMAICSGKIARERRRGAPDAAVIADQIERRAQLHIEGAALRVKDREAIARVTAKYGPVIRAWSRSQDILAAE